MRHRQPQLQPSSPPPWSISTKNKWWSEGSAFNLSSLQSLTPFKICALWTSLLAISWTKSAKKNRLPWKKHSFLRKVLSKESADLCPSTITICQRQSYFLLWTFWRTRDESTTCKSTLGRWAASYTIWPPGSPPFGTSFIPLRWYQK